MKKAKAENGKTKRLKIKDLPVGRKAGSVKGGAPTLGSISPAIKAIRKMASVCDV